MIKHKKMFQASFSLAIGPNLDELCLLKQCMRASCTSQGYDIRVFFYTDKQSTKELNKLAWRRYKQTVTQVYASSSGVNHNWAQMPPVSFWLMGYA